MKLDTSSYYPKSPLENEEDYMPKPAGGEKPLEVSTPEEAEEVIRESEQEPLEEVSSPQPELEKIPSEGEKVIDSLCTGISWLFVPLMMPVYGILLAFNISILDFTAFQSKLVFTLITAAFNLLIPMIVIILMKKMGFIDDIGLNGRKERLVPYIITLVCMLGTGVFLWFKHAPMWLVMFFAGGGLAAFINLLVNFRWKISAHAAGVAGITALILRIIHDGFPQQGVMTWLIVSIIVAGLVGSARVWLGRHTVLQILAGYAVGFLSVFFMTMIK